ncbi:hypothetical protein NLJ89_g4093 [Agrocybe chaxingu]|uniref:Autophagy-related protein 27 n=1 Tax=Agrocybe chaxingu TaxID=84603 RepID=A0A9W8K2S2_9AGAR|nr:hypothetical protein NLJ89_g4093 [Agrocybe chaxingu]
MDLVSPSMPPPSILFASLLLISHLTARGQARPVTLTHTATDSDLRRSCTFKLNGNQYDLCPLVGSRRVVEVPSVDADEDNRGEGSSLSASRRLYEVALGGLGLSDDRSVMIANSEATVCDDDTWVCMLDMTYARTETAIGVSETQTRGKLFRELRPIPIARKARGEKVTFGLDIDEDDESPAPRVYPLRLFIGGRGIHDRPQAKIDLLCHESDEVAFLGEERGVHSFVWATPHGCPMRPRRAGRWKVAMIDEEGDDKTEPPPDEDDGDGDLLPSNNRRSRRWIAAIIVISVLSVACGSILYSSERARHFTAEHVASAAHALTPLLSMAAIKLRPVAHLVSSVTTKSISRLATPFRVGDSQLVQWAEEDMALDDSEDTMVNGGGAYDPYELDRWRGDGLDEYIPLTISPKYGRGRRARSYGATPDVETFAERGLASGGVGRFFHK